MLIIADRQHGSTLIPSNNHSNLPAINGLTTATVPNGGGTSKYSNYNTVIAWGVPALQTVAVLVARFVDADELLGEIGIFYCWFAFPLGGSFSLARRHSSLWLFSGNIPVGILKINRIEHRLLLPSAMRQANVLSAALVRLHSLIWGACLAFSTIITAPWTVCERKGDKMLDSTQFQWTRARVYNPPLLQKGVDERMNEWASEWLIGLIDFLNTTLNRSSLSTSKPVDNLRIEEGNSN